jgi:hypothetical protein
MAVVEKALVLQSVCHSGARGSHCCREWTGILIGSQEIQTHTGISSLTSDQ